MGEGFVCDSHHICDNWGLDNFGSDNGRKMLELESWFTPSGTFWAFTLCYFWGTVIITFCAYFIMVVSMVTITKIPTKARRDQTKVI